MSVGSSRFKRDCLVDLQQNSYCFNVIFKLEVKIRLDYQKSIYNIKKPSDWVGLGCA